jgi:DNA-3-methyladenine glycosylase
MPRLGRAFFEASTPKVAWALLGSRLVRVESGRRMSGKIVEAEAYRGEDDPASHAFRGVTGRNRVMFGEGGHAYIYLSYGSNWCLNVTTEPEGTPGAVLIRAIEPVEGLDAMLRNRGRDRGAHLTDGPGRLTQALEIDLRLNGEDLVTSGRLFLEEGGSPKNWKSGPRVGVSRGVDLKWRFFDSDSKFVSRARTTPPQNP